MKKILYIFGFCCLLTLGFTACQQEEDTLVQLSLEDLQKRDSKKHPKLEYIFTANNNDAYNPGERRPSKLKYTLQSKDDSLHVFFQIDTKDIVYVYFIDQIGNIIHREEVDNIFQGKEFLINPAISYPYTFTIESKLFTMKGRIMLE